jgi:hypothetical protein
MEIDEKEVGRKITDIYLFLIKMAKKNKIGDKREFFYAIDLFYHLLFWSFNPNRMMFKKVSQKAFLEGMEDYLKKVKRCRKHDLNEEVEK